MRPHPMSAIINRKRYSTKNATLLASENGWNIHDTARDRHCRHLYRTNKGSYFVQYLSAYENEQSYLQPVSFDEALQLYGQASKRYVKLEDAFPCIEIEDA